MPGRAGSCLVRVFALLAAFAVAAALTAGAVFLLLDTDEEVEAPPPAEPTESPAPIAERPTMARSTHALDAPGSGGWSRGTLTAGTPLRIEGRSADSQWVAVSELGADGASAASPVAGWVPIDAVAGLSDIDSLEVVDARAYRLPVATSTAEPETEARPTLAPDLPDLVVREVFARENRLVVLVANEGSGDADGAIEASVDGGPFRRIDTGKALRPGDELERAVEGAYVQRRSRVSITLRAPGTEEEDTTNNAFEGEVAPDMYNDIEVLSVAIDPDGGHIVVELRNNSPIPLVGAVTLAVHESTPDGPLLLRDEFPLDVEAGATSRYDLRALTDVDAASILVTVSTDAISDADSENNTYPR